MDQQRQEARRAAAKAFLESLDKLQETFKPAEPPANAPVAEPRVVTPSARRKPMFDLAALEDAAADIERYMHSQSSSNADIPETPPEVNE